MPTHYTTDHVILYIKVALHFILMEQGMKDRGLMGNVKEEVH